MEHAKHCPETFSEIKFLEGLLLFFCLMKCVLLRLFRFPPSLRPSFSFQPAGAILRCSFHTAQAEEIVIEVVPPVTVETKEVLLIPQVLPDDTIFCTWYRKLTGAEEQKIVTVLLPPPGSSENGPGYTGRETVYPNCSLRIEDLRLSDTATYMLLEGGTAFPNTGNISLKVHGKSC